jgi:hypothetical protein
LNGWWFGSDKNRTQIYGNLSNIELNAAGRFGYAFQPTEPYDATMLYRLQSNGFIQTVRDVRLPIVLPMEPNQAPEEGLYMSMLRFLCTGTTRFCKSDSFHYSKFRQWYKAVDFKTKRAEHKRFKKLFSDMPIEYQIYYDKTLKL